MITLIVISVKEKIPSILELIRISPRLIVIEVFSGTIIMYIGKAIKYLNDSDNSINTDENEDDQQNID